MDGREIKVSLAHRAVGVLMCNARLHHRVVERRLSGLGVHNSQHWMLMYLSRTGKIPAQKEIAEDMNMSPASVAATIKKLAQGGYIEKTGCDSDNRRNQISITPAGMQIVRQSRSYFEEIERAMFGGLREDEIQALCDTLGKIMENLNRYEESLNERDSQTKGVDET